MLTKIKTRLTALSTRERIVMCIGFSMFIGFLTSAYIVGAFRKSLEMMYHLSDSDFHYNGFKYAITEGISGTLMLTVFFSGLIIIVINKVFRNKGLFTTDERGFRVLEKGTFGTAEFMRRDKIESEYSIVSIIHDNDHMPILGQLSEDGSETITIKKPQYSDELRNTMVLGSSGTSKSRGYVTSELINCIQRNESFVTTDPSGELYLHTADFCRKHGAEVRVLNLVNPELSHCWDILHETISLETCRLDSSLLNQFVSVFLHNTSSGDKGDLFWYELASGYLKATIGYAAYKHEIFVIDYIKTVYRKLFPECDASFVNRIFNTEASIRTCHDKLFHDALAAGCEWFTIRDTLEEIDRLAPPFNIEEVHRLLMDFDIVDEAYRNDKRIPNNYVGKIAYKTCTQKALSENVKASGILGTLGKLSLFTDKKLAYNLSEPGINLRNINKKLCAYYVICPEDNADIRPITSLFFSFLFANAKSNFDEARQSSESMFCMNPILDLSVILDEFHSVGIIGGTPDVFVTYMSDSRKRHIHTSIILQNITQIESLYGESNAETIISNCNTTLFFGANDAETKRFISEMSGQVTVMADSYNHTHSDEMASSAGTRNLLTPDEVGRIRNEVIVFRHGCYPLRLKVFDYRILPAYRNGEIQPTSLQESITPYSIRCSNKYHLDHENNRFEYILNLLFESKGGLSQEWKEMYNNRFYYS